MFSETHKIQAKMIISILLFIILPLLSNAGKDFEDEKLVSEEVESKHIRKVRRFNAKETSRKL